MTMPLKRQQHLFGRNSDPCPGKGFSSTSSTPIRSRASTSCFTELRSRQAHGKTSNSVRTPSYLANTAHATKSAVPEPNEDAYKSKRIWNCNQHQKKGLGGILEFRKHAERAKINRHDNHHEPNIPALPMNRGDARDQQGEESQQCADSRHEAWQYRKHGDNDRRNTYSF